MAVAALAELTSDAGCLLVTISQITSARSLSVEPLSATSRVPVAVFAVGTEKLDFGFERRRCSSCLKLAARLPMGRLRESDDGC